MGGDGLYFFFSPTNGNVGNAIRFVAGILIRFTTVQLHCVLSHCDSEGIVQEKYILLSYSVQFIMFIKVQHMVTRLHIGVIEGLGM